MSNDKQSTVLVIAQSDDDAQAAVNAGFDATNINNHAHPECAESYLDEEIKHLANNSHVVVVAGSAAKINAQTAAPFKALAQALAHQVYCFSCKFAPVPADPESAKSLSDFAEDEGIQSVSDFILKNCKGFDQPGFKHVIPHSETSSGDYLNYLIPLEVKGKPVLPSVLTQQINNNGEIETKPTNAPYLWLKRNLIVLQKSADGTYSRNPSNGEAPQVISEAEGVTDDRRRVSLRLNANDLSEKEGIGNYGFSGSPAEFLKVARAQRNARMVPTYTVCDEKGWIDVDGSLHYIYGDASIAPENQQQVLPNIGNNKQNVKSAGCAGSYQKWHNAFTQLIKTNPLQAVAAGFAVSSAALHFVPDAEPGILHVYGESSKGKTTTLQVAASLIGRATNPRDTSSWIKGWRTTDNGLEKPLAESNHAPLMLDEIHAAPARTDWQATAYMIANGRGKERMTKNAEARKTSTWCLQVLSSGEVSFADKIKKSCKGQVPGGLAFRVVDLNAGQIDVLSLNDPENWSEIAGKTIDTTAKMAEFVESTFSENYGHAWPLIIQSLRSDKGQEFERIFNAYKQKAEQMLPEDCSTVARRRTKHVAAALAGLELLMHVTGNLDQEWAEKMLEDCATWCFSNVLLAGAEEYSSGNEAQNITETVHASIMSKSAFLHIASKKQNPGNALGWVDDEGTLFLPTRTGFKQVCEEHGLDENRAKQALENEGWKKGRARHPEGGRESSPLTVIKAPGMFKDLTKPQND